MEKRTGARYADKPTVQVRTWIDASPGRVWELVSDISLMPAMSEELQSVAWLDRVTKACVGARFVGRNRHEAVGEWETTSHVIECEAQRVFAWAVGNPDQPAAIWRFQLTAQDGGTALCQWMQLGPGRSGLSPAIDRMPEQEEKIVFARLRELERGMTATLRHIKKLAEA